MNKRKYNKIPSESVQDREKSRDKRLIKGTEDCYANAIIRTLFISTFYRIIFTIIIYSLIIKYHIVHNIYLFYLGIFCGGYNYSLKIYTYERVRARNFARAWSFVQFSQAIPIVIGMPFVSYLNEYVSMKSGYAFSCVTTILGSFVLFLVDLHKRNISHHEHTR